MSRHRSARDLGLIARERLGGVTRVCLVLAFLGGAGVSIQAFYNGRLATSLGSAELAGSSFTVIAVASLVLVAAATGAFTRALRRLREGARPRWWHILSSVNGALAAIVIAKTAAEVGIALLTVALFCGQAAGSLVIDQLGLSPAGHRPLTRARLLGAILALLAIGIGALGSDRDLHLGLLALAVLAGAGFSLMQAALGHMTQTTGEPLVASTANFAVAAAATVVAWVALTGGAAPQGWSAPAAEWLVGGVIAVPITVILAVTVSVLGGLRLTLALFAGQALGALALDLVAPAAEGTVTLRTIVSLGLTFVAVAVSGITRGSQAAQPGSSRS